MITSLYNKFHVKQYLKNTLNNQSIKNENNT